MIKLAIDAMGSDKGSSIAIEASLQFVKDFDVELYVYGNADELQSLEGKDRIHVVKTTQVMEMTDGALAVRRKKDSSMVRAMEDLKNGVVDGVVSCASTGALLSSATLILGTMEHVDRPAIITVLPTSTKRGVILLDIGANAVNTPQQLNQFAVLGSAYAKGVRKIADPKVGLLNIGSEAKKGDDLRKETYKLLEANEAIHFIGNVEGKEVLCSEADIVVCDGFTGNVLLKTIEGCSAFMTGSLKEKMMSSTISKIGALLSKKALKAMKAELDPKQYGGALISGVNGAVVKGHGSSDAFALYNAIRQLYTFVDTKVLAKIQEELK